MSMKQTMCEFVHGMTCKEVAVFLGSIVRCMDCDYYDHWDASGPYREKHVCGYWDYLEIKPDGFCAWGERRES